MRITGGEWGGRSLKGPKGPETRPTSDANRLALFNILSHGLGHECQYVLDLFAGTGSLGLEALSRGATAAVFVENSREAVKVLRANIELFKLDSRQAHIAEAGDTHKWLSSLRPLAKDKPFDTIFCDPPYSKGWADKSLKFLERAGELFTADALFCLEIGIREKEPESDLWELIQKRERGSTSQCFYRRKAI